MTELNDDNFLIFAIKNYQNPSCTGMAELEDDLKRFKYLKRLFNRYETTGVLRERLILNHIITFYNVFGVVAGTRMFFNRIDKSQYPILKTFLTYLNFCPEEKFDGIDIISVPLDTKIISILRSLK